MKKLAIVVLAALFAACSGNTEFEKATDPQDAAREFVRSSFDGNYDRAFFYLYKDSSGMNKSYLDIWKGKYDQWKAEDKVGYKESNIIVLNTSMINDSTMNYVYSNSFRPDTTTIKVIRLNGEWLVDLKDVH